MKAAYINQTGPAENIVIGELPKPAPKPGEVLVRVAAVAVNPIDTYVRAGAVKMPLPIPFVIGCDLAGVVESVGPDVTKFKVGDRVWGSNQGLLGRQGTFAEYAAVEEKWLYPTPPGASDEAAAAGALVGITAHLGLVRDAHLQAGETLFVNGGSGGVGSMVVQMGKAIGARVIATAGSEEKVQACRVLGADVAINYKTENVEEAVRQAAGQGVDVWWETIREPNLELSIPLLARRGRLVLMAGRDAKPVLPLGAFYTKDCKILGFAMFNATPEEQQKAAADINCWLAEGKLNPPIDRVLKLEEAALAHRLQEESTVQKSGALKGKIVLKL